MSFRKIMAFFDGEDYEEKEHPPFKDQCKQFINELKQKFRSKKKSTIIITILLCVFALYLAGVIASIIRSISTFSITTTTTTESTGTKYKATFDFFGAIAALFDIKYSIWGILIILIIAAAITYWYIRNHVTMGDYQVEERSGAKYKKQLQDATMGSAREMTQEEIKKHFLIVDEATFKNNNPNTILYGKLNTGEYVMEKPVGPYDVPNVNSIIIGDAGSRKTSNYIIPTLMQLCRAGQNILCTDSSGEVFALTYPMFVKAGYEIKVFNTVDTEHSDSWNFIGSVGNDLDLAKTVTQTLCESTQLPDERPDPYFTRGMNTLLPAIILLVNTTLTDYASIEGILRFFIEYDTVEKITKFFDRVERSQPEAYMQYKLFLTSPVKENFISNLAQRLDLFVSKGISKICSRNGIDIVKDFGSAEKKTIIYVITDKTYAFVSALFLNSAVRQLKAHARDNCVNRVLPRKVYFVFEEFLTMGYVPNMGTNLSENRKFGMIFLLICQALPQFYRIYDELEAKEIMSNCAYKLFYGTGDTDTAELFEKFCGPATVRTTMKATSSPIIKQTDQEREGVQQRMLYDYNELMTSLDVTDYLLFPVHSHPIKLKKPYYKDLPGGMELYDNETHYKQYIPAIPEPEENVSDNSKDENTQEHMPVVNDIQNQAMPNESVSDKEEQKVESKIKENKSKQSSDKKRAKNKGMIGNIIDDFENSPINRPCINEDDVCNDPIGGGHLFKTELDRNGKQIRANRVRFNIPIDVTIKGEIPPNEYRTFNSKYLIDDLKNKCRLEKSGYILVGWKRKKDLRNNNDKKSETEYLYEKQNEYDKPIYISVPKADIIIEPLFRKIPGNEPSNNTNNQFDTQIEKTKLNNAENIKSGSSGTVLKL